MPGWKNWPFAVRSSQWAGEAALTRGFIVSRDPARQYIFMPPAEAIAPPDDASDLQQSFHKRFAEVRKQHADALMELAGEAADSELGAESYQLLHEALAHDPEHEKARAVLGFRQHEELGWVRSAKPTQARLSRTRQKTMGWDKGTYWEINSPHFKIYSAAGEQAGLHLAEELEQTYWVWRQVFFDYWSGPRQIQRWLAGDAADKSSSKQYQVILFRDKHQYVSDLAEVDNIQVSSGYYEESKRASFFYWDRDPPVENWRHEIVHQLLQENAGINKSVAQRGHAWLVEGIAMYFETMLPQDRYVTLGGFDATRFQYARLRCKREGFFTPMQELDSIDRQSLQAHPDAARLYTQASGVSQFLFNGQQGRYRNGLLRFVRELYRDRRVKSTLADSTLPLDQLDRAYQEFLNFDRSELARFFLNRDPTVLALGRGGLKDSDIALLQDCRRLRWLELSENPITDEALVHLTKLHELQQLFLDVTGVTDAGLPQIAKLTSLQELDLASTRVTDEGLRKLNSLKDLQVLWLAGSKVSDACIASLVELPKLKLVDLRQTDVTQSGVAELKAARPELQIMR